MADVFVQAMSTIIQDKVVFASAHPFIELADALEAYEGFPLSDDVRNKVMYANACRILGIEN
jgi:predicted TIM-barrel fold metal-dependent hydrolase